MALVFTGKVLDDSSFLLSWPALMMFCFFSGSGKTFTMKPLPIRAVEDLMRLLRQPVYINQRFKLWLSYFEIYGGKLFDLLSERKLVFFLFYSISFKCHIC